MELRNRKLKEKKGIGTVTTLSRSHYGATALGITALGIMAFSIMTFSITAFGIMTSSIECLHLTLGINETQHKRYLEYDALQLH
jgi:hypothetical protein